MPAVTTINFVARDLPSICYPNFPSGKFEVELAPRSDQVSKITFKCITIGETIFLPLQEDIAHGIFSILMISSFYSPLINFADHFGVSDCDHRVRLYTFLLASN